MDISTSRTASRQGSAIDRANLTRAAPPRGQAPGHAMPPPLTVDWARHDDQVREAQRLRHRVFVDEMGAQLLPVAGTPPGLDADAFDPFCEHLLVRTAPTADAPARVVGTYRVLTPHQAKRAGGYYSESEFDLSGLGDVRTQLVEFGRACIDPDYRKGGVLMMLWSGLSEILKQGRYEHVFGCASVSLRDDGVTAAKVWREVREKTLHTPRASVKPLHRYPVDLLDSDLPAAMPALLNGYLKLGARICGEPAWDPDFNSADLPMMMRIADLPSRYRQHFASLEHTHMPA